MKLSLSFQAIITSLLKPNKRPVSFLSTSTEAHGFSPATISHYFSLLHSSPSLLHLRRLHARLLRTSLYDDVVLSSKLVLAYSGHRKLEPDALSVFYHMPNRNMYSWNIVLGEFSRSGRGFKAMELFLEMLRGCTEGVRPDDFSLPLVLRACRGSESVAFGVCLHGLCFKLGLDGSLFVGSALVFMYVNLGLIFYGKRVFDEMPSRDSVLWTAVLAGYAQHQEPVLGLRAFRDMVGDGVELDWVVMVSLLSICGQLGWSKQGKSVHGWCVRKCSGWMDLNLGNAIIDFYVKCALLSYAQRLFYRMRERDVVTWSSLILGYGLSGDVSVALRMFASMHEKGVKSNEVTFLGLLSACAHVGLVHEAHSFFNMMKRDCGLVPGIKHYATMVNCLARAGHLEEAENLIQEMPIRPDGAVLGALLLGCRDHNNIELGERVAKKLIDFEPDRAGYYVLLSNMYVEAGKFADAERIRELMIERKVSKVPACSLMESKSSFSPLSQHEAHCSPAFGWKLDFTAFNLKGRSLWQSSGRVGNST